MLDIGWTELLVIGVVALIVIGPKDLPGMFRTMGRFTGEDAVAWRASSSARWRRRPMTSGVKDGGQGPASRDLGQEPGAGCASRRPPTKFEKWDPLKPTPPPRPKPAAATAMPATPTPPL